MEADKNGPSECCFRRTRPVQKTNIISAQIDRFRRRGRRGRKPIDVKPFTLLYIGLEKHRFEIDAI